MQTKLIKHKLTMGGLFLFLAAFLLSPLSFAAEKSVADALKGKPDGTIEFETAQYSNMFGKGRAGLGSLNYQGASYPFMARIKNSGAVPDANAMGVGNVYGVKGPGDFLGTFKPAAGQPGVFVNTRGAIVALRGKNNQPANVTTVTEFTVTAVDTVKD